jgi:polyisoprenoid-binding protein YceI
MKKIFLPVVIFIFLQTFTVNAQWKLDAAHSNLGFSIQHLGVSYIKGSVVLKKSTINTTSDDFTNATIRLVADMNTIDTDKR